MPAGVSQVTIDAKGAEGGGGNFGVPGGKGAQVQASFSVTAAEVLNVVVGGMGSSVASAGGGGGGSFVYTSATAAGLLIAAAGGGGARATGVGIDGSATTTASDGQSGGGTGGAAGTGGSGGAGGSGVPATGAGGGGLLTDGGNGSSPPAGTGAIRGMALANGSAGGSGQDSDVGGGHGGFGGGGGAASAGGGGGGGYNGGGGGAGGGAAGGGGGSFFAASATNTSGTSGANTGNGQVTISYTQPLAVSVYSLTARRSQRGVVVRWHTGSEADTLGFNVYRMQGHRRVRLNRRLLPALGGVSGRSYSFLDRRAPRHRASRYWLQDVSRSGIRTWHGPVRVAAA